jgi:transcriptional regulator with XRE-family HTH domain
MAAFKDIDLPFPALRTAQQMGALVSAARRSRGWTQADLAAKADVGLSTVRGAEQGDARIALQHWLRLLWATEQLDRLAATLDPTQDEQGMRFIVAGLPRRVRRSRA